ncbi:MAG TPA: transglycosylase SLT domain-containing protein [Candidatus Binatia bacterium]|nr:transglycosylase SLT domain-containing protein [Candidatus Binatia bacterium]
MRLLSRITALTVLVSPALLGHLVGRISSTSAEFPFLHPVTPEDLREKGALRFSISPDASQKSPGSLGSFDFDYDLLTRFASDLGVSLSERPAHSDADAAQRLRSGMVDMALLSSTFDAAPDMVPADPCLDAGGAGSKRLRVFLRGDSPELGALLTGVARRIADAERNEALYQIYCRYEPTAEESEPVLPLAGQISRYAGVLAKYAGAAGLDWRLVAALIFEESSFEETAVSTAGATGLMQLMPWIPAEVGVTNASAPEGNIRAGVLYLSRLSAQFPEARLNDRLAIVLAAYLLGPGHVADAQNLARELGLDPQAWQRGLEQTLPLLEDERFNDHCRLGAARGRHAVDYVNRILERYETYRRHLDRDPDVVSYRQRGDA